MTTLGPAGRVGVGSEGMGRVSVCVLELTPACRRATGRREGGSPGGAGALETAQRGWSWDGGGEALGSATGATKGVIRGQITTSLMSRVMRRWHFAPKHHPGLLLLNHPDALPQRGCGPGLHRVGPTMNWPLGRCPACSRRS